MRRLLIKSYQALYDHYGPQHWWPARMRWEVCCGAILTQNTAWSNVEKALANLREVGALDARKVLKLPESELSMLIRPSGFFTQKSKRLKILAEWFLHADSNMELGQLREQLLALNGVGPETADSILLYAFDKSVFVVDAYTRRLAQRHWHLDLSGYHELQALFMDNLEADVELFKEFHALIVVNSKSLCRKNFCDEKCPLRICNSRHMAVS